MHAAAVVEDIGELFVESSSDFDTVNDRLGALGVTDGLPVVPPTEARIRAMLGHREPDASVAVVAPAQRQATLRRLAVCAVLAGCQPPHFPVLTAAVRAVAEPEFNLLGIQTTTGSAAVLVIVNGPSAAKLGFNAGCNALGPGVRSNATVGRALALALRNIGGAIPGRMDMATMGQPGKYTFCCAEHEAASPWEPLHVSRGFRAEQDAVTVVGAAGTLEVKDERSTTGEDVLTTFAHSMLNAGSVGGGALLSGGEPLLLIAPEHARIIGRSMSRAAAQAFLHEHAVMPLASLAPQVAEHVATVGGEALGEPPALRVTQAPEDFMLAVVGGVGIKSTYVPTWSGTTRSVTAAIAWD